MEGDMEKILSLIVPSYNMEKLLPRCLGSLELNPALMERLEVLVVNDGSKDRTSEIAHGFAAKWPGTFRVIDKPNGHYGSCINAALKVATGTYVKVLDADDWLDRECFEKYLLFLVDTVDEKWDCAPDLILNDFVWVDEADVPFKTMARSLPPNLLLDVDDERVDLGGLYMHAVAYKTAKLRAIGYAQTEGICYTDNEWCHYPLAMVEKVAYCNVILYRYLFGRVGQSMERETRNRNLWMMGAIAIRMARQMGTIRVRSGKVCACLTDNFLSVASNTYVPSLIEVHTKESDAQLKKVDDAIREASSELYELIDRRIYSHKINFHFIACWRKTYSSRTLALRLYRFYNRIVRRCLCSL